MHKDRIECETLIAAPVEQVWALVARAGFWVADDASLPDAEAEPGDTSVARNAQFGDFGIRVEKVDPPTYVAYRWTSAFPGEEARDDNSTLVEFTLVAEGDGTRLTVVESGFGALAASPEVQAKTFEDNSGGWPQVLDGTKRKIEESPV